MLDCCRRGAQPESRRSSSHVRTSFRFCRRGAQPPRRGGSLRRRRRRPCLGLGPCLGTSLLWCRGRVSWRVAHSCPARVPRMPVRASPACTLHAPVRLWEHTRSGWRYTEWFVSSGRLRPKPYSSPFIPLLPISLSLPLSPPPSPSLPPSLPPSFAPHGADTSTIREVAVTSLVLTPRLLCAAGGHCAAQGGPGAPARAGPLRAVRGGGRPVAGAPAPLERLLPHVPRPLRPARCPQGASRPHARPGRLLHTAGVAGRGGVGRHGGGVGGDVRLRVGDGAAGPARARGGGHPGGRAGPGLLQPGPAEPQVVQPQLSAAMGVTVGCFIMSRRFPLNKARITVE